MSGFIKVATTDELADQQAKLVEVEGHKIALIDFPKLRCISLQCLPLPT